MASRHRPTPLGLAAPCVLSCPSRLLPYDTHCAPLTGERLMPNIWFTADFHLGHRNIIRYCNRPCDSVEAMNSAILERLNGAVKANDVLYFLGDFCIVPKAVRSNCDERFGAKRYLPCRATTTRIRAN